MTIASRSLGRTGINVSSVGYGAWELRGYPDGPHIEDSEADKLLNAVLDSGINIIDTAIDYGRSEELIGRYLAHRRNEFILASKCGCPLDDPAPMSAPPSAHVFTPELVRGGVEMSLRRLRTDHLDLVQLHASPSREVIESNDTIATLLELRNEGKIRFLGVSGSLPNLPDQIAMNVSDVFQIPYSAIQREHEGLIADAASTGAGTLIRGGLARGGPSPEKNWKSTPLGLQEGTPRTRWESANIAELLGEMTAIEFVLRFTLSHPGLSSVIVGTSNREHLSTNLEIAEKGALPRHLYEEARRRLDGRGSISTHE